MSLVLIRGAGDVGTAVGILLRSLGHKLVYTELLRPTTLRWAVAFSEAVYRGEWEVEGVLARRATSPAEALELAEKGVVAVLAPEGQAPKELAPEILIDARMAKRNLGTKISEAPIVIGLGPGFTAGVDCHAVVETLEGPELGRVYFSETATPPTHKPCEVDGLREERVVRAPCAGVFHPLRDVDKFKELGLRWERGREVSVPVLTDCDIIYECRIIAKLDLVPAGIVSEEVRAKYYSQGNMHTLFFGEILASWRAREGD